MNQPIWEKHRLILIPLIILMGPLSLLFLFAGRSIKRRYVLISMIIWGICRLPNFTNYTAIAVINFLINGLFSNHETTSIYSFSTVFGWIFFGILSGAVYGAYAAYKKYKLAKKYFFVPLALLVCYLALSIYINVERNARYGYSGPGADLEQTASR